MQRLERRRTGTRARSLSFELELESGRDHSGWIISAYPPPTNRQSKVALLPRKGGVLAA
jgi:hypothetical protein